MARQSLPGGNGPPGRRTRNVLWRLDALSRSPALVGIEAPVFNGRLGNDICPRAPREATPVPAPASASHRLLRRYDYAGPYAGASIDVDVDAERPTAGKRLLYLLARRVLVEGMNGQLRLDLNKEPTAASAQAWSRCTCRARLTASRPERMKRSDLRPLTAVRRCLAIPTTWPISSPVTRFMSWVSRMTGVGRRTGPVGRSTNGSARHAGLNAPETNRQSLRRTSACSSCTCPARKPSLLRTRSSFLLRDSVILPSSGTPVTPHRALTTRSHWPVRFERR